MDYDREEILELLGQMQEALAASLAQRGFERETRRALNESTSEILAVIKLLIKRQDQLEEHLAQLQEALAASLDLVSELEK